MKSFSSEKLNSKVREVEFCFDELKLLMEGDKVDRTEILIKRLELLELANQIQKMSTEVRPKLVTRVPGARMRSVLTTLFTKKVFERVFAEPISDEQVEYMDALAKGNMRLANWIVARGHMIVLSTVAYYAFSSTIGKLIRDLLKPTKIFD